MTFQSIPIDGPIKVFAKQMKQHGFKLIQRNVNGYAYRGRYITGDDNIYVLISDSKSVYRVVIEVNFPEVRNTESWQEVKEKYDYVVALFSGTYDTADIKSVANFEAPYEEGDGNEVNGILNGKCHYYTDFSLPQGMVRVMIDSTSKGGMTHELEDYDKYIL